MIGLFFVFLIRAEASMAPLLPPQVWLCISAPILDHDSKLLEVSLLFHFPFLISQEVGKVVIKKKDSSSNPAQAYVH